MEGVGFSGFEATGNHVKKKRTHRRRPESQSVSEGRDLSSFSSTPPSDDVRAGSSDENSRGGNSLKRKELSLSQCISKVPGTSGQESENTIKNNNKADVGLASSNYKTGEISGPSVDGLGSRTETKVKKVKLKVGGVTRTIAANSSLASDTTISQHKPITMGGLDCDNTPHRERRSGLRGIPWKDFSRVGVTLGREESVAPKGVGKNGSGKQSEKPDSARRSKRASKKRAADSLNDDDENDDEIKYLEKLKNARLSSGLGEDEGESGRKHRRLSKFSGSSPQSAEKKRSPSMDTEYEEDEEVMSDGEPDSRKRKRARREAVDSPVEPKQKLTLTTRQRALQSGKDASTTGGSVVEFPSGLPPATSGKPKEQLTDVEQQVKRAEAAQRRKLQNEKAARESEAEAIRKILGQDSSRKKKDDMKKKRVADLAQVKAADELLRASNTVRLIMGPNGTTVTFPNEMGLPSIFTSEPTSYPPPREKCAGPLCSNPFKYRDSKTKLPLCSLECYKAVKGAC